MKFFCCLLSWARILARRFSATRFLRFSLCTPPSSVGLPERRLVAASLSAAASVVASPTNFLSFSACMYSRIHMERSLYWLVTSWLLHSLSSSSRLALPGAGCTAFSRNLKVYSLMVLAALSSTSLLSLCSARPTRCSTLASWPSL